MHGKYDKRGADVLVSREMFAQISIYLTTFTKSKSLRKGQFFQYSLLILYFLKSLGPFKFIYINNIFRIIFFNIFNKWFVWFTLVLISAKKILSGTLPLERKLMPNLNWRYPKFSWVTLHMSWQNEPWCISFLMVWWKMKKWWKSILCVKK